MATFPYLGETLAFLTAIVWSVAVILFKKSGERINPIALNLFKSALAITLLTPTTYFFGENLFRRAPVGDFVALIISGIVGIAVADTLFFVGLNYLGAGLTSIIGCVYAPFIISLSALFLGEKLTALQLLGVSFVVAGIVVVNTGKVHGFPKNRFIKGFLVLFCANLLMAAAVILMKPVLDRSPLIWATEIRLLGGFVALLPIAFYFKSTKSIAIALKSSEGRFFIILGSFLGTYVAMILWVAGMKFTGASVAAVLNQTSNVFIFLFAAIILKERITTSRVVGLLLAIMGVIFVTIGG